MRKYVDVDELKENICKRVNNPVIRGWLNRLINETPAADVVEVVRCRNCKHGGPVHDACSTGDYYCLLKDIYVFNWDFCRCGIKENEDE